MPNVCGVIESRFRHPARHIPAGARHDTRRLQVQKPLRQALLLPTKMVRLVVGGISHETNTYAAPITGLTQYEGFAHHFGQRLLEHHEAARTVSGGIIARARELGWEVVPTSHHIATPSGTISDGAYLQMRRELVAGIEEAMGNGGVDAVALEVRPRDKGGKRPSFKALCRTQFSEFAAQLWICAGAFCGPD